jgi:DNA repair exonuclease SbcCD nuclease subunit
MPTFLHSADWQIGKPYARVADPDKRARLRRARLEAIARIGEHLHPAEGSPPPTFLLVAGDLFDSPTPADSDVSAMCAAIGHLEIPVLVIPGNHDHGAPGAVWHSDFFRSERQRRAPNLQVLLEAHPVELDSAVILPCPLLRRTDSRDPCGWLRQLDWSRLPADKPRLVLAHGAVRGFGARDLDPLGTASAGDDSPESAVEGSVDADEENPACEGNRLQIRADWMEEVDYVALGDWHGMKQVASRAWYAGTPEPDRFPRSDDYLAGRVLRVTAERGSLPQVTPLLTGVLGWHPLRFHCGEDGDLERLERRIDELLAGRVGNDLLLLEIGGSLTLAGQRRYEALLSRLRAQLLRLKIRGECRVAPSAAELAALTDRPGDPLVSRVALILAQRLEKPSEAGEEEADAPLVRLALSELHRLVVLVRD